RPRTSPTKVTARRTPWPRRVTPSPRRKRSPNSAKRAAAFWVKSASWNTSCSSSPKNPGHPRSARRCNRVNRGPAADGRRAELTRGPTTFDAAPAMKVSSVKGFHDVLPDEAGRWTQIESQARQVFARYGFAEIRLPIVERTELFSRSIGDTTDIV